MRLNMMFFVPSGCRRWKVREEIRRPDGPVVAGGVAMVGEGTAVYRKGKRMLGSMLCMLGAKTRDEVV